MPPTRRRALVADDDPVTRMIVADTLTRAGFEVHGAADGKDAIAVFLRHAPFALLVVDIVMPHMNGTRVVELLCRSNEDLKVLFISSPDRAPALGPGQRFLAKPFSGEALLAAAGELLGETLGG